MSHARRFARLPAGRISKYVVVAFWLIVLFAAAPLAGKLTGAEKNDSSAWAPGSAESTKVLNLSGAFQSPDVFPAVVVYERPAGLTAADQAKAAADVPKFAKVDRVTKVTGPLPDKRG